MIFAPAPRGAGTEADTIRLLPRIHAQSAGCFQRGARKHPSLARLFSMLFCASRKAWPPKGGTVPPPRRGKNAKNSRSGMLREFFKKTAVPWGPMITCVIAGGSPPCRCSASNIRSRTGYRRGRPAIHRRRQSASLINSVGPYEAEKIHEHRSHYTVSGGVIPPRPPRRCRRPLPCKRRRSSPAAPRRPRCLKAPRRRSSRISG